MSCWSGRSQLKGNCLQRVSQTWPRSGHMARPLGPPPHPFAGCQPRTLPRALRGLPTCLQHSRGSRPEGAGAPARAARVPAPGRGRRPSPGQRRTPGRPAASPGQPPDPRRSAHLAGKWSLSPAGKLGRHGRPGAWGEGGRAAGGEVPARQPEHAAGAVASPPALRAGAAETLGRAVGEAAGEGRGRRRRVGRGEERPVGGGRGRRGEAQWGRGGRRAGPARGLGRWGALGGAGSEPAPPARGPGYRRPRSGPPPPQVGARARGWARGRGGPAPREVGPVWAGARAGPAWPTAGGAGVWAALTPRLFHSSCSAAWDHLSCRRAAMTGPTVPGGQGTRGPGLSQSLPPRASSSFHSAAKHTGVGKGWTGTREYNQCRKLLRCLRILSKVWVNLTLSWELEKLLIFFW